MIDLVRLQSFVHAAEHLSFSEAARRLNLTQPTVSHHIKRLEDSLGVTLFVRSGSNVMLTEAGRLLLPWAHKLVRQAIEVGDMMASLQEEIAGHLRIACSTTAGKYILPQLAARFCRRYAGTRVSILSCIPSHIVPRLLEGEANLAVISSYHLCGDGFACQEFFRDAITLIVPADHPWTLRPFVEPGDLLQEPFLMREATSGTRRVLLTELAKHDITEEDLNVFLELGNAEAIVRTVQAGFGISFVSNLAADWALALGAVVAVPVRGLAMQRAIYMIRRQLAPPNRAQDVFWDFVHSPSNADLLRLPQIR
jgi:DNA-binding transcriptional LysR family regulator